MKILSMTATFGKLSNETITFSQGLNVIDRPNEWGKSTWCAFITAMLYGIDTGERTKNGKLADKEHYAPWSGAPMAGRMDIDWNGRKITIERSTLKRVPFGAFTAYETDTHAPVPELTGANCAQLLLGAEKEVFQRSAFIRQADLPVSDSAALRSRLNALVATGDETDTTGLLLSKLNDLKNKCRANKSKGLLPEAEKKRDALMEKQAQRTKLAEQSAQLKARLAELESYRKDLQNHQAALAYQENFNYAQKLAAAQNDAALAQAKLDRLTLEAQALPDGEAVRRDCRSLRMLQSQRDGLYMQLQMLPPAPTAPTVPEVFRGVDPEAAVEKARQDRAALDALSTKKPGLPVWIFAALLAAAIALALIPAVGIFLSIAAIAVLIVLFVSKQAREKETQKAMDALTAAYPGIPAQRWEALAADYLQAQTQFQKAQADSDAQRSSLKAAIEEVNGKITALTGGQSSVEYEEAAQAALAKHDALTDATRELAQKQALLQALEGSHKVAQPPAYEDKLTHSAGETMQLLGSTENQIRNMGSQLGSLQGQMLSLGEAAAVAQELFEVNSRIAKLEEYYKALEIAMETLEKAKVEMQKRFAPRISQKAQDFIARLTGNRYNRLYLGGDFTLNAATDADVNTHTAIWRSDGTIDQLYLALRLAVAQALVPDAPLILDDALVRFDDDRMASALELLREESESRQVLLFTCQSREKKYFSAP